MNSRVLFLLLVSVLLHFQSCKEDDEVSRYIPVEQLGINEELPDEIKESSGLILIEKNFIWTHNDSGDGPFLYEVNLSNQQISHTTVLKNASFNDWEAITKDDSHTFIGDIGNNNGDRTDLAIHFFPTIDLQKDSISPLSINFSYESQNDFTSKAMHNFDCEAMIPIGDFLYLFTKNRANLQTDIYRVPKSEGNYSLEKQGSLAVDGLITAAAISPSQNRICLLGYNVTKENTYSPFIWLIDDFTGNNFLSGKKKRVEIGINTQTEGIYFLDEDFVYFSSEAESGGLARYYGLDLAVWF